MYTMHLGGRTAACHGLLFIRTMHPSSVCPSNPVKNRKSEGGPPCSSMPFSTSWGILRVVKVQL